MPKDFFVSICIPVRNGARYLPRTLDSLMAQSYRTLEIVVSDNCSTDETPDIIRAYQVKHPIRYIRNDIPMAVGEDNFNRCVELAQGDAVCVFHADDVYHPDIIKRQVEVLQQHERVGAVLTMADVMDENGKVFSRYSLPKELKRPQPGIYGFDEIFATTLKHENSFLVCPSAMVRKRVFDELGGWEYDKYKSAADLGLWFKIAQRHDIAILDEPLVKYRISRQQESFRLTRQRTERADFFRIMDEYIPGQTNEKHYVFLQIKDAVYRALNLAAEGQKRRSRNLLREAFGLYARHLNGMLSLPKSYLCVAIAFFLLVIDFIPGRMLGIWWRNFVLKLVGLKKTLFSY